MRALEGNGRGLRRDAPREEVEAYLAGLVSRRVFKEEPARLRREVADARADEQTQTLQKRSNHIDPKRHRGAGERPENLNRHLRRVRARKRRLSKVVADMIERARRDGADPNWTPEAFPALDWRIKNEAWSIMRDVSGRRARIFTAALPPPQGARLLEEATRIATAKGVDDGFASVRGRELVAGAWVSWRLSRPVRARRCASPNKASNSGLRENPWAGGRVVDGYARGAFSLLMRDLATGRPMSVSKLFYKNGSGQQGVFGYLATARRGERRGGLPRIDGVLGLYSRFQPSADRSKYVGPPKRGGDGKPLLDASGKVQRYALGEHWYHRDMCGRRAVAQADRGDSESRSLLRDLCPWLFEREDSTASLIEQSEGHAVEGVARAAGGTATECSMALAAEPPGTRPD